MLRTAVLISVLVPLLHCSDETPNTLTPELENSVDSAKAAALDWLALVDQSKYAESWDEAAEFFRSSVPKSQWEGQVGGVRAPLGGVVSREFQSATVTNTLPNAPDGDYVVIVYQTQFENRASAIETVTPMRDPDGSFRVAGYYVR